MLKKPEDSDPHIHFTNVNILLTPQIHIFRDEEMACKLDDLAAVLGGDKPRLPLKQQHGQDKSQREAHYRSKWS